MEKTVGAKYKPFNFRLPVALSLALAAGVTFGVLIAYFAADGIFILIPTAVLTAISITLTFVKKSACVCVRCALTVAFFAAGAIYVFILYCNFCQADVPLNQLCEVTGTVERVGGTSGGKRYLIIGNARAENISLGGKIIAYLGDKAGDYCEKGYKVTFLTNLQKQDFFSRGGVGYRTIDGVKYYCSVYGGMDAQWAFSLTGSVNTAIKNALFNNLEGETAAVCYAMMTGDSSLAADGTLTAFRYGGVAHIFAVSGLHIGVVFGAVSAVTRRLELNKYISAALRIFIVFFYAGVCGFTPSSVRAAVACTVSLVALLTYQKYDALNAISLAAVILLFINPLYLFDVGFVMSFSAVLGISLLSANIRSVLAKLPQKAANAIAVGTSSLVATIPTQIYRFGYVSASGLLLNLVLLPFISVLYVVLFALTLLSAVIPPIAGAVMPFAALPMDWLINAVVWAGFDNALITITADVWIYAPFVLLIIGLSDKLNAGKAVRAALSLASAIFFAVALSSAGEVMSGAVRITFSSGNSGAAAVITTRQGTVVAVSSDYSGAFPQLNRAPFAVIIVGEKDDAAFYGLDMGAPSVYLRPDGLGISEIAGCLIHFESEFTLFGVQYSFDGSTLTANAEGVELTLSYINEEINWNTAPDFSDLTLLCPFGGEAYLRDGEGKLYDLQKAARISFDLKDGGYRLSSLAGAGG